MTAAAVVFAVIATGAAAEERSGVFGVENLDQAATACSVDRDKALFVGPDGVRPTFVVCVDDVSEAYAGCAYVDPDWSEVAPAGVIVADGATGYVPCDEVSELLGRGAQEKLLTALRNVLRELETQTNYLRVMCEMEHSRGDCEARP